MKNDGYSGRTANLYLIALRHVLKRAKRDGYLKVLFPSPQRGEKDIPAHTFMESLRLARELLPDALKQVGFHDMRHFFISFCVMAGVPPMTIAAWVGHLDGGVLIGKVYGHLNDEHKRAQAARVVFAPVVLSTKQAANG